MGSSRKIGPFRVFCFPCLPYELIGFTSDLMFGPSLVSQVLCPLLTPAGSTGPLDTAYQYPWPTRQASPGKDAVFPSIYPPHLPSAAFGSKDFALLCKLIQLPLASYVVPVRRAPVSAGFLQILRRRRHPCLKLTATATFTARDFHPRDSAHAGRTKNPAPEKPVQDDAAASRL